MEVFLGVLNYALELFFGEGEEEVACKRLSLVSAVPGGLVGAILGGGRLQEALA
jgi:hypothetical protein